MVYSWNAPAPDDSFHPRLDPISAWLFSRQSAFLQSGEADTDAGMLYAMTIDAAGFDPSDQDSFRALSIPNPVNRPDIFGHPFSLDEMEPSLGAQFSNGIKDVQVTVVPLPNGGPRSADILRTAGDLGSPDTTQPDVPMSAPTAIIGIIDHGINIFHHRFRRGATGSRILSAWMQGARRLEDGRIRFGREWTQAEIEAAQDAAGSDEDALLRQIGVDFAQPGYRPLGFRSSHGTHVLDLAAGLDPTDAAGSNFPIIAVTLPPEVTRETSGSMLAVPFALGLEYIADRARRFMTFHGITVPVYVNFSFGLSGGPRAGLHRLEQTISRVCANHTDESGGALTVVTAAGNNNLARGHAAAPPDADGIDLRWQLQPGDPSANFLEIRLEMPDASDDEPSAFSLTLTPPGSTPLPGLELTGAADRDQATVQFLQRHGANIGQVSIWQNPNNITVITLAIDATDPGADNRTVAPAGEWQVSLTSNSTTPSRIDAWILRDDVPGGFRDTGRQSYFIDPAYAERDLRGFVQAEDPPDGTGQIRRAGTLNAIATGVSDATLEAPDDAVCWVVGGYTSPVQAASYSATALDALGEKTNISARSDCSPVRFGVKAAGTRSGTRVSISGTSVAAPQVVRYFAMGDGQMMPNAGSARLGDHVLISDSARLCGERDNQN
ncbi:S8/S53 family peptidase [Tateyamaria pelophila]|uniref:hypothetical protein n=1 Tax=Tateyamaria pelophila TaxID=328415 RepID=UPI001CBC9FEB|nr:hypothetical protein [Tateyamaria pelophila]